MDSFCPLPFIHSCTNVGGRNKPCCRFSDHEYNDRVSPDEYFTGEKLESIRKQMLNGQPVKGCKKCYLEEANGLRSMRNFANDQWSEKYDIDKPTVKYIEIGLSNLCNYSCVTCDASYSTTWWNDIDKVNETGIDKAKPAQQIVYTKIPSKEMLKEVEKVKLLGGEPFMEKNNLLFLKKLDIENITLELVTNGSVQPNKEWKYILDNCKQLQITISVDGIGQSAEWNRYGTNWNKVDKNIDYFKELVFGTMDKKHKINLHTVIHAMNVLDVDKVEDYFDKKLNGPRTPSHHGVDFLSMPSCLNILLLPDKAKKFINDNVKSTRIKKFLEKDIKCNKDENQRLLDYANKLTKIRKNAIMTDKTKELLEIVREATN